MKRTPNPETCICYRADKDPRFCKAHTPEAEAAADAKRAGEVSTIRKFNLRLAPAQSGDGIAINPTERD